MSLLTTSFILTANPLISLGLPNHHVDQGSANFFCKELDSKYFRFWLLPGLCHNYSTPLK